MASISLTLIFPSGNSKEISHPVGVGGNALRCDMQQLGHSIMRVKEEANVILTEAVNREASDQTQSVEMRSAGEDDDDGRYSNLNLCCELRLRLRLYENRTALQVLFNRKTQMSLLEVHTSPQNREARSPV